MEYDEDDDEVVPPRPIREQQEKPPSLSDSKPLEAFLELAVPDWEC